VIPRRGPALATVALAALALFGCKEPDPTASPSAAEAILARSIAFHDPEGRWGSGTVEMTWVGTGANDDRYLGSDTITRLALR
jgi:hypothetical protein